MLIFGKLVVTRFSWKNFAISCADVILVFDYVHSVSIGRVGTCILNLRLRLGER